MIPLTLDASVLCKWYLDPALEPDVAAAQSIAVALRDGNAVAVQPPHWIAEVGAVVTRILPDDAQAILDALHGVGAIVASQPAVYRRAVRLAIQTGAHLFDTLYHAVALETPGCTLVTADERYWKAARSYRRVALLRDWTLSAP